MKRQLTLLVALWALLGCTQAQKQQTPAERQLAGWLEAFNSGDRAVIKQFLDANFPERAKEIDQELDFRDRTGGFDLKKVEESAPTRITAVMKERDGSNYARLVLELKPEAPHKIRTLNLRVIPRPADFAATPSLSENEAIAALKAELEKNAAKDRFSGAALVAGNGKTIFAQAYGLADREKKIPNSLNTRFRIGSMNKMFTAVAIAQLAQAGRLKFTDTVGKFLTDYPNGDIASKVTIHHLLTHTGGTGDIFGPEFERNRLNLLDLKDYVALYGKRGLQFEPGSRWEYSNYGFILLGVVVERVSGQNYYDYVREHIYLPAGMTSTNSLPESEDVPNRSVGYMRMGGRLQPNNETLPFRGTSAGGGYSTVEDLLRFANALLEHNLLNEEYTSLIMTGKVDTPRGKYGYGFMDVLSDGVRSIGHGGGAPGMNGDLRIYPASGYIVAVLANLDPPSASRIADFVGERLPAN
ncbi:MAG TPA: serine hydrolase domain-containing protein [Acidobacteriota bacterium]|nr:serine hydrolase domain-containing protein [Acidobacteriota bacterium]